MLVFKFYHKNSLNVAGFRFFPLSYVSLRCGQSWFIFNLILTLFHKIVSCKLYSFKLTADREDSGCPPPGPPLFSALPERRTPRKKMFLKNGNVIIVSQIKRRL